MEETERKKQREQKRYVQVGWCKLDMCGEFSNIYGVVSWYTFGCVDLEYILLKFMY